MHGFGHRRESEAARQAAEAEEAEGGRWRGGSEGEDDGGEEGQMEKDIEEVGVGRRGDQGAIEGAASEGGEGDGVEEMEVVEGHENGRGGEDNDSEEGEFDIERERDEKAAAVRAELQDAGVDLDTVEDLLA